MGKSDYKLVTKKTYDIVAKKYAERDKGVTPETFEVKDALKHFVKILPPRAKVLDIGSGGGRDARFLFKYGLKVIGIDFSGEMIKEARKLSSGIAYRVMDFEKLKFRHEEFNGVWANASLHHIPKSRLKPILKSIHRILKQNGIFFLKVKYGKGERIKESLKFEKRIKRYFAFYRVRELRGALRSSGFIVLSHAVDSRREWIDIFARK